MARALLSASKKTMRLVVFGVSNNLTTILDTARAVGLTPSLVVTNTPETTRDRTRSVHETLSELAKPPAVVHLEEFSPSEGECYFIGTTSRARDTLVSQLRRRFGITCCTLIHPTAWVSEGAALGAGVYVGPHTSIGPRAELCDYAYVAANVHVAHDTIVQQFANVFTGANVGGYVSVGYGAMISMGATIIQELDIGPEAVVAAGAVVIHDVPARTLVAGVPAKVKKKLDQGSPQ